MNRIVVGELDGDRKCNERAKGEKLRAGPLAGNQFRAQVTGSTYQDLIPDARMAYVIAEGRGRNAPDELVPEFSVFRVPTSP